MSRTIEQIGQSLLDARGYIVIGSWKQYSIGDIVPWLSGGPVGVDLDHAVVIVSETDKADYDAQLDLIPEFQIQDQNANGASFYRVVAE